MTTNTQSDAISNDVPGDEEERQLTPRELAMEAISRKHIASLEQELGHSLSSTDSDDQLDDQLAEPAPEPAPEPVVTKVKVKVEGLEEEVDQDTLVRTYQKNRAADRRLEEATTLLREAEAQAAQIKAQAAQPVAAQPVENKTPDELRAKASDLLDKMFDGDKESAAEALVTLLADARGGDQPTPAPVQAVDEDSVAARVEERMAVNAAFKTITTDYPDLINDPDLELLTATKINRAVAAGTPRHQAMLDAADEVYKLTGRQPAGRQPDPVPDNSKNRRHDNKERLDKVPVASASATAPSAPMEGSPSSVIAEMAQRRLGQSLPRPAS